MKQGKQEVLICKYNTGKKKKNSERTKSQEIIPKSSS